ncbi:hypothetical protein KR074_012459, partial [Drosophila pseudoananassae]
MAEFLEQRCRTLEAMDVAMAAYTPSAHVGRRRGANNSRSSFIVTNSLPSTCALCGGWSHIMSACPRFLSMPPEIRLGEARRLGLCRKCLQTGHHMRECLAASCRSCGRRHHSLLHFLEPQASSGQPLVGPPTSAIAEVAEPVASSPSTANALVAQGHSGDISLLATANIFVRSRAGSLVPCRALLDSGSQVHVITSRLASQLQLRRYKSFMAVSGIGDTGFATDGFSVDVLLRSHCSEYSALVNAVIAANITDLQPSSLDVSSWNIPGNLSLADPEFFRPQRIDLLIGASLFYELLCVGQIKLSAGLPLLQKTRLGWVVCGGGSHVQRRSLVSTAHKDVPESATMLDDQLDSLLRRFWEVEDCSDSILLSPEQELCEGHYQKNTVVLPSGRFEVRLPFKSDPSVLGNSFEVAKRRFLSLEKRLSRDPNLKKMYVEFMEEYESLGHMSPTSNDVLATPHYVIPHQCVLRPQSTSTKLRVVFDASCKTSTHKCLNDLLMVGPTIQEELYSILLRFRLNRFALIADIKKMYRQVMVNEADRRYQLIVWRKDPSESLKLCKLNTVTYGTAPAPFLAIRCLKRLSESVKNTFPRAA